jgi:hypothetical protein
VAGEHPAPADRFRPLRPASGVRLVLAFTIGPLVWLLALVVVAIVFRRTNAIGLGILVAIAAFGIAMAVLGALYAGRRREERRYAARR